VALFAALLVSNVRRVVLLLLLLREQLDRLLVCESLLVKNREVELRLPLLSVISFEVDWGLTICSFNLRMGDVLFKTEWFVGDEVVLPLFVNAVRAIIGRAWDFVPCFHSGG